MWNWYLLFPLISNFNSTLIAPEYSEYSEDSISMQWPPCYYDDWTPPMDYYQPCGNNINPPQQPDQDYWPGQIFPDCCTYECAPECFPGPEWGIFLFFLTSQYFRQKFYSWLIHLLVEYTANVLTKKTTGTGNCGVPAGKICTIYGKGL